jgi:hypothetical protein
MYKKGDLSLSFGMIFSIILIIGILGVSFYAIRYFIGLKQCTDYGLFNQDLDKEVAKAYESDSVKATFTGTVPGAIKEVCFGSLKETSSVPEYVEIKKRYGSREGNLFFYPPQDAEDICNKVSYRMIEHLSTEKLGGFTCFHVKSGKVSFKLEKGSFDNAVYVVK